MPEVQHRDGTGIAENEKRKRIRRATVRAIAMAIAGRVENSSVAMQTSARQKTEVIHLATGLIIGYPPASTCGVSGHSSKPIAESWL